MSNLPSIDFNSLKRRVEALGFNAVRHLFLEKKPMIDYMQDGSFKEDIDIAISLLKSAGCTEIYLFGSLAKGNATADSDIDIAVRGIEPEDFFAIYGQLMFSLHHRVDLVDLNLQKSFGEDLISSGELMRVA